MARKRKSKKPEAAEAPKEDNQVKEARVVYIGILPQIAIPTVGLFRRGEPVEILDDAVREYILLDGAFELYNAENENTYRRLRGEPPITEEDEPVDTAVSFGNKPEEEEVNEGG